MKPGTKLLIELGPLVVFFAANAKFGILPGTAAFMAATVLALAATWVLVRRIPTMPLVSAGVILVFGGLALWLKDETFVKLKPTIIYLLFAGALFFGLATGRNVLRLLFEGAFSLTPEGWRLLTWRWAFFFVALAGLNEVLRRVLTTDGWVNFKAFGFLPITIAFMLTQIPLLTRHKVEQPETETPGPG